MNTNFSLRLYRAFISCANSGAEGRFTKEEDRSAPWYLEAIKNVDFFLQAGMRNGIYIDPFSLMKSGDAAESLVDFVIRAIPDCSPQIDIAQRMHGKIHFERKISFKDRTKEEVVSMLNRSNHSPELSPGDKMMYKGLYEDAWMEKYLQDHPLGVWEEHMQNLSDIS